MVFISNHGRHLRRSRRQVPFVLGLGMILLGIAFAAAAVTETEQMNREQRSFEQLAQTVAAYAAPAAPSQAPPAGDAPSKEAAAGPPQTQMLPQYQALWQQNPDLYGWIKIDNGMVDYPVMHTPENPEKYLRLGFDGHSSWSGSIFLDARCSAESDNLLVHGHNMKNQTMFGSLLNYQDIAYWRAHPTIRFDTLFEERTYEILAVFFDRVYDKEETCFKYYDFIDAEDAASFDAAIRAYQEKSLYDTAVSAQYGDHLLTLSTCAYHIKDGRFVVVAKRIR